ncbi:MAG: glucose-1-phosphate adenylyltransferase [Planctomycetia bacterium]|nr:glucose-1-phosphate adenylyltransferase [Planctomycetia bacterium]
MLAVILAGGKGERLEPLTRHRAKPAVPFGGSYRIIDFALSNCINSNIKQILLLTQYKSYSLSRHLSLGWTHFFCRELNEYLDVIPPQQRIDDSWYRGTADAVYQNIYSIEKQHPQYVLMLGGDHIYKMNYQYMLDFHLRNRADATISVLELPVAEAAGRFGVLQTDGTGRVLDFQEKPAHPYPVPGRPERCYASMGIYIFNASFLFEELCRDATRRGSRHDFGGDLIPRSLKTSRVFAFPFSGTNEHAYWRDVGTIDAYYAANRDLIQIKPELNIYDRNWPIYTAHPHCPPPKFVFSEDERRGVAVESLVCSGSIISGGSVFRSILGHRVRVNSWSQVEDSILFADVAIGRNARIRRAIIDKGVVIPAGTQIGYDPDEDRRRGFHITESGLVVVPAFTQLESGENREDPV